MNPANISTAFPDVGDRLKAPAAARNMDAICDLLQDVAPAKGAALELASGTGEHIARFAALMQGLNWQASDVDATRRASADAHAKDAGVGNLAPAIDLNATTLGWGAKHTGKSLIFLSNLLHLISDAQASTLISEAATALTRGGRLVIYGPFMRGGELTSDGDISFHQSLKVRDPLIGYKDDFDVMDLIQGAGLDMMDVIEMPANNLVLVAEK